MDRKSYCRDPMKLIWLQMANQMVYEVTWSTLSIPDVLASAPLTAFLTWESQFSTFKQVGHRFTLSTSSSLTSS